MRRLPVCVLCLSILLLLSAIAARARSVEPPRPGELRIYFLHLATIDAAADKAEAEGTPGDTVAWRRFEQEKAGLTETEAALLKDVAFRCNRALEGDLEGQNPMEIVRQAADELRLVLGPAAFEAVSRRIRTFLRPAIRNLPAAALEGTPEDELAVEAEAVIGPSVSVYSLLFKLQDGNYMANCGTAPNDLETLSRYAGGVTMLCQVFGGGLTSPIDVPCGSSPSSTTCSGTYPPVPNRTRVLLATHGLRMKLVTNACQVPTPVYDDPLAFCRIDTAAQNFIDDGDVLPIPNSGARCWDPAVHPNVCRIATSSAPQISFIELSPSAATAYPGGTVRFSSAGLQAIWTVEGPGTIDSTGLYTAPATITSEQTVTVKGCDAAAPGDCDTATVTLKPLQVQVAPTPVEVLPEAQTTLTATLVPAVSGQAVVWTMTPNVGTLTPSGNTATYKAPAYDDLAGNTEITVRACLSPATGVCGTATVIVPKLLFTITAPKTKLELNEAVQVTASLLGSNVQRAITWKDPAAGTLSVINEADPLIRRYEAPGAPPYADVVIEACLVENPAFCARLPLDLPEPLDLTTFNPDTGRWQAGTLTDFTITGNGFRPGMELSMGDLPVTVTSMTETVIKGKVRILVAAAGVPLRMFIAYPDGSFSSITRSPREVEPATVAVSPATAQVQGGGSKVFDSVCLTSTALPCTSQEFPSWTASQGSITPTGLNATYSAPASVASQGSATVTACWSYGEESKCGIASVSLLPNGPIVSVTPETASVEPGQSKQFTAQVTNDPNTAVTWSISPQTGTITQGGLYTAPATFGGAATVTVTATSVADSSRKDTATVTLVPAPLTVTSTASPASASYGTAINWTVTASGGTGTGRQFALFRKRTGTSTWIPAQTAPAWQTGNLLSWTPGSGDVGSWDILLWVKDSATPANGYGASHNPGTVQVVAPLTVACSASPAYATTGTAISWTATASGGTGVGRQYAFFRRRSGTSAWTPSVTAPNWQTGNVMTWTPGSTDVGAWDVYIWVKDSATPPSMNTYGYAAGCNPGGLQVVKPLSVTSTASPALATYGNAIGWTATATGGIPSSTRFAVVRRVSGTATWSSPVWQTSGNLSWTPASTDVKTWEISIRVRDGNTPAGSYAASYNPGNVRVVAPLSVTGTGSPSAAYHSNPLTWTATGSGGTGVGRQYALFRRKAGTSSWIPDVTAPAWSTNSQMSWTPSSTDVGTWEIVVWFKDANTPSNANGYGFGAYYNAGPVQVYAHPTVGGTGSPSSAAWGTTLSWTATGSGGIGSAKQYALFRRKAGTSNWIPSTSSPAWQTGNVLTWTPGSGDVGTWEIIVWMKDAHTPSTMNGYGFAAYYNAGPVAITAP